MRFLRDTSIKNKQMSIIMLTASVALLLACGGFLGYELLAFKREMARNLSVLASKGIGDHISGMLHFEYGTTAEALLEEVLGEEPNVVEACIYKEDGTPFAIYRRDSQGAFEPPPVQEPGARFVQNHLEVFHPVKWEDADEGETVIGYVYLRSDLKAMHARLARYAGIVGIVFGASLLAALLLSSFLQRLISEPILHLVQIAREVSASRNYQLRARKAADDELGVLVDGFNAMLVQIQERDAALQKAHDGLEKRVEERTRELQQEILERTRAEAALQQQFARLSLLNSISEAISERQDIRSIVLVVIQQLEDHLGTEFGAVGLFDEPTGTIRFEQVRFKPDPSHAGLPARGLTTRLSEAGMERSRHGETVYIEDLGASGWPLFINLAKAGIGSVVAVPLMVEGKLFGLLMAGRISPGVFTSGECEFLRMLAGHVALAANQAQLYSQLQAAYLELRQTQQAVTQQERLRALGQMASGIAHDINNALSPVVVYSELLARREPGISDTARKYLEHIQMAGEDIAHIVARMREFYRPRDEREHVGPVVLNELAQQVVGLTRPRWRDIPQERGVVIQMETDLAAGLPPVPGSESELREAFTNLILNAVDAMPAGGELRVRTRLAPGTHGETGGRVVLEISDTGIGMDEATRARCLEPFFTTKGKRGTGLGLAMVYGVMERHEASIEIESEPGRGTLVRLIFPVAGVEARPDSEATIHAPARPLRILCVDDEPLLRQMIKEMLEADGHSVTAADGGQCGIDMFREGARSGMPFDVVISDLGMPHVDGRQVVFTIKKESPATPVILLTGWGAMMNADGNLPAFADLILSKPPRIKELREALRRFTGQAAGE